MIGVASGISEYGYKVFMASFGSFLTGRYDQIRCSLAYSNRPVVLVGTHVGMAIGKDGVTQMGLEDVSIMRALPNMTILNPATYTEAVEIVKYLCNNQINGPHYLRIGRQPVEDPISELDYTFEYGKDITLFTTGCVLSDVLKAKHKIESDTDLTVRVINFHTLKPIDKQIIATAAKETKHLFSVEDHSVIGGLGSIVADVLCETKPQKLIKLGLQDQFPESGPPTELYEKYGLTADKICEKVLNHVDR
jgi:transketolase